MKTNVLRTSILALFVAAAGHAQSSLAMNATIPFSFVAGRATLPAGQYTVDQGKPGMMIIKSADRKANVVLFADTVQRGGVPSASTLLFHRYGDVYVLSQVWTEGSNRGLQTEVTKRERELAARSKTPGETVVAAIR